MTDTHRAPRTPEADRLSLLWLPRLRFHHHPDRSPRVCNTPAAAVLNELGQAGVQCQIGKCNHNNQALKHLLA